MSDPFAGFAAYYNLFPRNETVRKDFLLTIFTRYGVRNVLDCACGTGADLILLNSLGFQARGSDISEAMLAEAGKAIERYGSNIPIIRADFRNLPEHFGRPFDAIICLDTSLPQLLDENEIRKALSSMKAILAPSGILVLSQGMSDKCYHTKERFHPIINTADHTRVMIADYYEEEWEIHVLDFIRSKDASNFMVHNFKYRTLLEDDYIRLLMESGFGIIESYDGFSLKKYDKKSSDSLVIVACQ